MNSMSWYDANRFIERMNEQNFGDHNDWRLPSVEELITLFDYKSKESIADQLTAQGYIGVRSVGYWSSTTYAFNSNFAWVVVMYDGFVYNYYKTFNFYVWPVRGGHNDLEFLRDLTSLDSVK